MAQGGGYSIGWEMTPLTEDQLDTSGDWKGGPHPAEEDPLFKLACTHRDNGNQLVKDGKPEAAIAKYSEMIMVLRGLGSEEDVVWNDAGEEAVRQLRAAAYLNLSLCFLKTKQWQHASNTATRALQGDKDPPDPKENVLAPEKKAKALFRRAQAQSEGLGDLDKAKADLKKALEYAPEDKGVQQELKRITQSLTKTEKAADKKMAGFLSNAKKVQSGEGIFDEKLRPQDAYTCTPELTEVKKLSEGLWLAPKDKSQEAAEARAAEIVEECGDETIDYEELSREINELREDKPQVYKELQEKLKGHLEQAAADKENEADPPCAD